VLFVLLAAQGVTIVDQRTVFSAHVFIGTLLIGPVFLKFASTGYRFVRYDTGSSPYRSKGPPRPLMRMLAPPLVLVTLVLFVSGVALVAADPAPPEPWVFLHNASFVIWFGQAAIHVVVNVRRVPASWAPTSDGDAAPRRRKVSSPAAVNRTAVAEQIVEDRQRRAAARGRCR